METLFKVGDVVWMKSASPSMTIEGIGADGSPDEGKYNVVWFDIDAILHRDVLAEFLLTATPPVSDDDEECEVCGNGGGDYEEDEEDEEDWSEEEN